MYPTLQKNDYANLSTMLDVHCAKLAFMKWQQCPLDPPSNSWLVRLVLLDFLLFVYLFGFREPTKKTRSIQRTEKMNIVMVLLFYYVEN